MKQYLNDHWLFTECFTEDIYSADPADLKPVRLPHSVKETPLHYFDESEYQMISGYRRDLFVPPEWADKRILLTFEGVAHSSEVYLNGTFITSHHCGYTAFTADLTGKLKIGEENRIVVRVNSREDQNIPPFGFVMDYMTYGGIYREVYLEIKEQTCIEDIFLKSEITSLDDGNATLLSEIQIEGFGEELLISQRLIRGEEERTLGKVPCRGKKILVKWKLTDIALWNVEHPIQYQVVTELYRGESLLDSVTVYFGFRKAEFRKDGFYLNGKKLKIRGLNRHQSYPYVGYAMPESMQKLDADILKWELGLNAVRTSHYPQSHHFLDRCDEIGLLVFTEIPGWQHIGNEEWKEQAVQNVRDMVLQYRNHTSIILWGVRINESADDDEFYIRTNTVAHELDDSRPTGGVRALRKSSLLEDVYTYNDFIHDGTNQGCEARWKVTSDMDKPYLITEYNGHMYPTKTFDSQAHRTEHALRHARVLDAVASHEDICGSFGWCFADYNTHKDFGSGDRICYHGVMDMFRNPKLAAFAYAIQQEELPYLAISASMDIGENPECNRGDTYIFTNADSVRMYKNDVLLKEYGKEEGILHNLPHSPILVDDYVGDCLNGEDYTPRQIEGLKKILNTVAKQGMNHLPASVLATAGKLMVLDHISMTEFTELYTRYVGDWGGEATTYRFEAIQDGEVVDSVTKAPVKLIKINALADHTCLKEVRGYDVVSIRIAMTDEHGDVLNFCNDPVLLELSGDAELIGPKFVSLQGGLGGTYIKSCGVPGKAVLKLIPTYGQGTELHFEIEV